MGENSEIKKRRSIYFLSAIFLIIISFIAFTPRYFIPVLTDNQSFRPVLHLHALTGCAWLALFLLQTALIRNRSFNLHKTMGKASLLLAGLLVVSGVIVSLQVYWRTRAEDFVPANPVLLVNLSDLLFFTVLYGAGLAFRAKRKLHRPLMFLAALSLMNAAIFRVISYIVGGGGLPVILSHLVLIMGYVSYLVWLRRSGGTLPKLVKYLGIVVIIITALRVPIGFSPLWEPVADWVFSLAG